MHAACTSVGLRMDIAAKAETICFETPRPGKDCILLFKGSWGSFPDSDFGSFLSDSVDFRTFVEGKTFIRSTGVGSECKDVEEKTEVVGIGEGGEFDRGMLATESNSLSDPASLSHSSKRMRLTGLGDCVSFSNGRL